MFFRRWRLKAKVTRSMFENLLRMYPNLVVADENFCGIYYCRPLEGLDQIVIVNGDYRKISEEERQNLLNLERMRIKFEW